MYTYAVFFMHCSLSRFFFGVIFHGFLECVLC